MASFQIFNFSFIQIKQPVQANLFEPTPIYKMSEIWDKKQNILSDILHNETLQFHKGAKIYNHQLPFEQGEIYLFKIANNGKIKREINFTIQKEDHNPSCYVIIDNRHDCQNIAIQELKKSFSTPNQVANIIEQTLNDKLREYRLKVTINAKYSDKDFWVFANAHPLQIKEVRFHFLPPNIPDYTDALGPVLGISSKEMNGALTAQFNADEEDTLTFDENSPLQKKWTQLAGESGKPIEAKLIGSKKIHRIGANTLIMGEITDKALQANNENESNEAEYDAIVLFLNKHRRSNI